MKLKLQSSQAALSYRVAAYFLDTLQIVASGMALIALLFVSLVDAFVISFSTM
ncbi:MAG: hypothetical protein IJE15_04435 [Bacteroidaceae bacterium]|nr:hypothetical protein [Bacteroidaceae bacterium]